MKKKIIEGNKLIAEFMGYKIGFLSGWISGKRKYAYKNDDKYENIVESIPIDQLKYHTSWDWLMPVVEKIKKCGYDDKGFGALKKIDHWLVMVQINELWLACIHFINWYNSNPTRSGQKLKDDE